MPRNYKTTFYNKKKRINTDNMASDGKRKKTNTITNYFARHSPPRDPANLKYT